MKQLMLAGLGAVLTLVTSRSASAYCLTHDCNPADPTQGCMFDDAGCIVTGVPISWPSLCVGFSVQQDGSVKYGISAKDFGDMVQSALERWTQAQCQGGGAVSLQVQNLGSVACDSVEINHTGGNANIWMFRDDVWPYIGGEDVLGMTTVHYDLDKPDIQDVDVELNGSGPDPLSTDDPATGADLDSILTHEAGHFLGLSHTKVAGATMAPGYTKGDTSVRSLEQDDIDAICAAYPASRPVTAVDCTPLHGFSGVCGGALPEPPRPLPEPSCEFAMTPGRHEASVVLALAAVFFGLRERRRRRG
ncbi:MAG TPA: matrixin family metalloprotease [Polyangiaceae bacterium]|jgi:hypothetical protein